VRWHQTLAQNLDQLLAQKHLRLPGLYFGHYPWNIPVVLGANLEVGLTQIVCRLSRLLAEENASNAASQGEPALSCGRYGLGFRV
jgi:hypothetical protein